MFFVASNLKPLINEMNYWSLQPHKYTQLYFLALDQIVLHLAMYHAPNWVTFSLLYQIILHFSCNKNVPTIFTCNLSGGGSWTCWQASDVRVRAVSALPGPPSRHLVRSSSLPAGNSKNTTGELIGLNWKVPNLPLNYLITRQSSHVFLKILCWKIR